MRKWNLDLDVKIDVVRCNFCLINTLRLRPRQSGQYFADDMFNCIFLNKIISIIVSLTFVPNGHSNNIPASIWRSPVDKRYLYQRCSVYWHIYASLGFNEFRPSDELIIIFLNEWATDFSCKITRRNWRKLSQMIRYVAIKQVTSSKHLEPRLKKSTFSIHFVR